MQRGPSFTTVKGRNLALELRVQAGCRDRPCTMWDDATHALHTPCNQMCAIARYAPYLNTLARRYQVQVIRAVLIVYTPRRGHANLLLILLSLTHDPRRESKVIRSICKLSLCRLCQAPVKQSRVKQAQVKPKSSKPCSLCKQSQVLYIYIYICGAVL